MTFIISSLRINSSILDLRVLLIYTIILFMKKEELNLIRGDLEVHQEIFGPDTTETNARLDQRDGVGQFALECMRHNSEQAKANLNMVRSFIASLPLAVRLSEYASEITTNDQSIAKSLQKNIVWKDRINGTLWPCFIIGTQSTPNNQWSRILIFPACAEDVSSTSHDYLIQEVSVRKKDLQAMEQDHAASKEEQYSPDEIAELFNVKADGKLHLSSKTHGSYKTSYDFLNLGGRKQILRRRDRIKERRSYYRGIPDEDMKRLGVYERFFELAEAFGKCDSLDKYLEERKHLATDSPVDIASGESELTDIQLKLF